MKTSMMNKVIVGLACGCTLAADVAYIAEVAAASAEENIQEVEDDDITHFGGAIYEKPNYTQPPENVNKSGDNDDNTPHFGGAIYNTENSSLHTAE